MNTTEFMSRDDTADWLRKFRRKFRLRLFEVRRSEDDTGSEIDTHTFVAESPKTNRPFLAGLGRRSPVIGISSPIK